MKRFKLMMTALMMTIVTSASAMTYTEAKKQALFLADKMAYELNLTADQYEAAYEINLDYLMAVNDHNDLYGTCWTRRNLELQTVLATWQYNAYIAAKYFYRPVYWSKSRWTWRIYSRYTAGKFYKARPAAYATYRGGNTRSYYTSRTWSKPARQVTTPTSRPAPTAFKSVRTTSSKTFGNQSGKPGVGRTTPARTVGTSVSSTRVTQTTTSRTSSQTKVGTTPAFGSQRTPSTVSPRTSSSGKTSTTPSQRPATSGKSANASRGTFGGHR